ncbi:MAG: primase, partial [Dehalococcoidia bacterium]|nr:primase [Dehalococcoidia bacterium]
MSVVDEIRQKIDIVDVISETVHLQKAGRNFQALCPFHSEKTPSFVVSPERQTWHCFGACGTGGDIFSFLMKKENLEFGDALRILANRVGVTLVPLSKESKVEDEKREKLYQTAEAAAQFYSQQLGHSAAGATALQYLKKRGLTEQTIQDFQLGYNPSTSPGLYAHLLGKGYQQKELVAAGLVSELERGETRDRFPGRLIFPIRNERGQVCGFGARSLDNSMPKYINTPQTDIFDKGGLLYGLDRTKTSLRRLNQAIIVEGYMDVLMSHQQGFVQTIASMGTSLTEKQVGLLKKYTKNIILALDADSAGTEATLRAHDAINRAREIEEKVTPRDAEIQSDLVRWESKWENRQVSLVKYENILDTEIKVLVPTEGKDPDEVIKENAEKWQQLINGARPLIDYILETVALRNDLTQASGQSKLAQEMLPIIAQIKDTPRRAFYIQKLSRSLRDIKEETLHQALKEIVKISDNKFPTRKNIKGQQNPLVGVNNDAERTETYCLAMLVQNPELRNLIKTVSPDYFENSQYREIFRVLQQSEDNAKLAEALDPTLSGVLSTLQSWPLLSITTSKREVELVKIIRRLKEMAIRRLWKAK